jgi:hypothetical protein
LAQSILRLGGADSSGFFRSGVRLQTVWCACFVCRKSLIESLNQAKSRSESSWIVEQMTKVEDEMFSIEPQVKEIQQRNKRLAKPGCVLF